MELVEYCCRLDSWGCSPRCMGLQDGCMKLCWGCRLTAWGCSPRCMGLQPESKGLQVGLQVGCMGLQAGARVGRVGR